MWQKKKIFLFQEKESIHLKNAFKQNFGKNSKPAINI